MKITVESYGEDYEVTLNWNGKEYTEKWEEDGTYCACGMEAQMEADGINAEGTIIEDVLSDIDSDLILELAEYEQTFCREGLKEGLQGGFKSAT